MADYNLAETSSANSMKRKKKRKLSASDEKPSKSTRSNQFNDSVNEPIEEDDVTTIEALEDSYPWRNLQLVLSLKNKNLDVEKQVELAYDFVKLGFNQVEDDSMQSPEVVSFERVIVFLNNWVQSTLISSEKKVRVQFGVSGSCLDYRCWKVFKFCLDEGTKRHVSMSINRDILKVIHCIAKLTEVKVFSDDEIMLYSTILDCISSVFVSHGGVSNDNLDLWILVAGAVLELVLKVITNKGEDGRSGGVVLSLACLVLEPFTKFLRLHPNKKSGFHDFVDRLLEPLLYLLHVTHQSVINTNNVLISKLLKLNDEVLCQGLFHSSHIDGFMSLQSLTKYKPSDDGKQKDSKTVIKSFHRHLFDKLGRITVEKKAFVLFGVGELFRLYVRCIRTQNEPALSSEIRKSLFDFFVQVMEPFLGDIDAYIKDEMEVGSVLEDVYCTLKSVNSILISLVEEEVYVRVDDTSEGACGNFLKLICDKITILSVKLGQIVPLTFDVDDGKFKDLVEVAAKEVVLCISYLLKIDYEVLGNDLESLWHLMFSYGILGHTLTDKSSAISEIVHLGCHIVNLYSELRQASTSVFALCKAIRRSVSSVREIEINHPESFRSSVYHESFTNSLRLILCSPKLRLSVHNAIKSIPEGQVSLCIQELATDLSETLEWMKGNSGNSCQDLKAEVLGNGLSEVYAQILDSLMVTTGNSSLVGVSLNDLTTVIRPILSILISQEDGVHKFLSEVSGRKDETDSVFAHWIYVFFFRLYLSSRSLYRQAVSLAPPTTSKKMSEVMRDTFTAYSANDWLEKTEKDAGYFSWISQSSVSLLYIIEAISNVFNKESLADISPLIYVLNAMIIQRLVDLNRQVNSFEFVIKRNENEDDIHNKQNKRLQKRLLKLTTEATGLVNVMTGHFSLLKECQLDYSWDIAVAAIDKKSLPCAIWCIVCQNIDIWSMHAAKKKLKMFLTILLQSSLPYASDSFKQFGERNNVVKALNLKAVTGREISLELLSNTMLYEEKFVRKHMASSFCKFLKELVSPLFSNGVDIELQEHPNWPKVLNSFKIPSAVPNNIRKIGSQQEVDPSVEMIYTACETSLNFLTWMPKRCLSSKSFSLYAICILNLERFIVGTLLGDNNDPSPCDHYKLLRLFLCCRRTLKTLMATYCEENLESSQQSLGAIHFEGKFPALWLLESLHSVQHVFSKDENTHVNDLMFSLMDYTSYVFLTLAKGSFVHASHFLISSRKPFQQKAAPAPTFDQEDSIDASNFVIHVAETLKDQSQILLTHESEKPSRGHVLKLSSVIACFQGFLWGLSSALCHMDACNINLKAIFLRRNFEPVDKLKLCIDTYTSFVQKFLCELVSQDDKLLEASRNFHLEGVDTGSVRVNISLSRVLAGENLEDAFFFRQLFVAYSAILKLSLQIKISVSTNLVNIFVEISEIVLLEFSNYTEAPSEFTFVFLDGIGKFLEELANHLSSSSSTLPAKVYEKLVDLHLKAIGKCIYLQQERATLESHETESSTKTMNDPEFAYSSLLDELKNRLRLSFKVLVSKPSELYISSAVQSIKKALIGLHEGNYQIYTGNSSGGKVTSVVAAGIDCLDVVLEAITGRKGLSTVKTDILGSVCCLFNVIYHLQGPQIFYKSSISNTHNRVDPDSGSVVLMCIEVLTKVSGKHALYQMDACHVAQALSIPSTLFQKLLQLTISEDKTKSMSDKLLDRHYSVELYAACCRMLYTFLRHHKRESLQHIALLQTSVSVLLHCMEMVNKVQSRLVWGLQEGVKCGAFLRRIYEEIRQQKDVIGQDCRLFLSSYIVVYSGYGPLKAGIMREVDEALRPGVYALIDACSPDDLQYLHTVLGEGPCRNTLANLQHDYKVNFQYEGKV